MDSKRRRAKSLSFKIPEVEVLEEEKDNKSHLPTSLVNSLHIFVLTVIVERIR